MPRPRLDSEFCMDPYSWGTASLYGTPGGMDPAAGGRDTWRVTRVVVSQLGAGSVSSRMGMDGGAFVASLGGAGHWHPPEVQPAPMHNIQGDSWDQQQMRGTMRRGGQHNAGPDSWYAPERENSTPPARHTDGWYGDPRRESRAEQIRETRHGEGRHRTQSDPWYVPENEYSSPQGLRAEEHNQDSRWERRTTGRLETKRGNGLRNTQSDYWDTSEAEYSTPHALQIEERPWDPRSEMHTEDRRETRRAERREARRKAKREVRNDDRGEEEWSYVSEDEHEGYGNVHSNGREWYQGRESTRDVRREGERAARRAEEERREARRAEEWREARRVQERHETRRAEERRDWRGDDTHEAQRDARRTVQGEEKWGSGFGVESEGRNYFQPEERHCDSRRERRRNKGARERRDGAREGEHEFGREAFRRHHPEGSWWVPSAEPYEWWADDYRRRGAGPSWHPILPIDPMVRASHCMNIPPRFYMGENPHWPAPPALLLPQAPYMGRTPNLSSPPAPQIPPLPFRPEDVPQVDRRLPRIPPVSFALPLPQAYCMGKTLNVPSPLAPRIRSVPFRPEDVPQFDRRAPKILPASFVAANPPSAFRPVPRVPTTPEVIEDLSENRHPAPRSPAGSEENDNPLQHRMPAPNVPSQPDLNEDESQPRAGAEEGLSRERRLIASIFISLIAVVSSTGSIDWRVVTGVFVIHYAVFLWA